jgi:hypothetical protein
MGWYDDTAVYIPKNRLHEAAGKTLKRTQVACILNNNNLLVKKQDADRFTRPASRPGATTRRSCDSRSGHIAEPTR